MNRTGDPVNAEPIVPRAALTRRMYEIPLTKVLFLAELQILLDNYWDEAAVHAEINRMEALITPVAGSLTAALAPIRTWVDARRAIVQGDIDTPPVGFADQPIHFCDLF
jgi:hypothetical protein